MATMAQKYSGKQGLFSAQLETFAASTKEKMDEIFRGVVIEIGRSVIMLTAVDTGRARANWQFTIESPATSSLIAYDKAGYATVAKLVSEVQALESGQTAWIVNNLRYAIPLEYGHSDQSPNGMVRVTLARFQQIVNDAVRVNQ